jgi:predicted peptidase
MQRMVLRILSLIPFSLLVGCGGLDMAAANHGAPAGTGFSIQQVTVDGQVHNYGLFVPYSYVKSQPMPAMVFLHGILQAGSDGTGEMTQGLGPNIAKRASDFPAFGIFPQSGGDWTGEAREKLAIAVLDDVEAHYSVDRDRIVLTGLSNGGYGTWHIGADHSDRFSALVPIAGQADPASAPKLTNIPLWCFHNSGDIFVGVGNARTMVEKIKAAGSTMIQYTESSAFGHSGWDKVYGDPKMIDWMVAQRVSVRGHAVAGK